jgi:predicted transcriptional regulator
MKNKNKKELTLLTYLIAELKLQNDKKEDVIPDGWFNTEQVAKEMERSRWTARCHIKKALEDGIIERTYFRKFNASNHIIKIPYYKHSK